MRRLCVLVLCAATVVSAINRSVGNIDVIVKKYPTGNNAIAVRTDAGGTARFWLSEPGEYDIEFSGRDASPKSPPVRGFAVAVSGEVRVRKAISKSGAGVFAAAETIALASLALAQQPGRPAAPVGSWTRVMSLSPGADTRVKRHGVKKRISGKFAGATGEAIQITVQGGVTSIPKSEVEQVSVARKRKVRNALLGAAIGGGFGAGVMGGYAAMGQREDADENWVGIFAVIGAMFGAMIGAPLGLASGAGHATLYDTGAR